MANPQRPGALYALGYHLYQSGDNGHTWVNLTGFRNQSVIGPGQHDLAISPRDPQRLAVANEYGVWTSVDGGLTWSSLNSGLPNLDFVRLAPQPAALSDIHVLLRDFGTANLSASGPVDRASWVPRALQSPDANLQLRAQLSSLLGASITAATTFGDSVYAGSFDGRLWTSSDQGKSWNASSPGGDGPIERIFVDSEAPRVAVAVASGTPVTLGSPVRRVLRTLNNGNIWDDVTGNLPEGAIVRGVTADRSAGAAYLATDHGVYYGRVDLNAASSAPPWTLISASLPAARVLDVQLDASGNKLYALLDGYGVYVTAAPHNAGRLRVLNAADLSHRAAAPGSLLSVQGLRVDSAHAYGLDFPVLSSASSASQIQVPFEVNAQVGAGPMPLQMQSAARTVNWGVSLRNVSPAIFEDNDGLAVLLDADTGLTLDASQPLHPGDRLQLLMTGLGRVRPDWPTGRPAPFQDPPTVIAPVRAMLDGSPVDVTKATLAPGYVGAYIIEFRIPRLLNSGPVDLHLIADGQESNHVRLLLDAQ